MTWVAWLGLGGLYNPIGPIRRIVTVAEKQRGSQDRYFQELHFLIFPEFSYPSSLDIFSHVYISSVITSRWTHRRRWRSPGGSLTPGPTNRWKWITISLDKKEVTFSWWETVSKVYHLVVNWCGGENLEQYENLHKLIILNEQCLKYQSGIWSIQNITLWIRKWQRLKCLWKMKQLVRDCSDFVFLACRNIDEKYEVL